MDHPACAEQSSDLASVPQSYRGFAWRCLPRASCFPDRLILQADQPQHHWAVVYGSNPLARLSIFPQPGLAKNSCVLEGRRNSPTHLLSWNIRLEAAFHRGAYPYSAIDVLAEWHR